MFGSQALEVALGLALVLLLVSLIMTAVRESIEAFFKTRAVDLERAIAEILGDRDGEVGGPRDLLYRHPLIAALYSGNYETMQFDANDGRPIVSESPIVNFLSWVWPVRVKGSRRKPTYIPRRQFAQALLDLARNGELQGAAARTVLALRPPADASAIPNDDEGAVQALVAEAINAATGEEFETLRAEIESWYDGTMDRASGWYRRRTQTILFWLGLVVALVLNINAVTIGKSLATDDVLRAAMTRLAEQTANDSTRPAPTSPDTSGATETSPEDSPADTTTALTEPVEQAVEDNSDRSPTVAEDATSAEEGAGEPSIDLDADDSGSGDTEHASTIGAENQYAWDQTIVLHTQFLDVGLPIGWGKNPGTTLTKNAGVLDWLLWISGFFITAFATTLGAPFWFDVLNKFVVIRSTVKPKEKSGDEGSEDRQT